MNAFAQISFFLALASAIRAYPSAAGINPQPIQGNQINAGDPVREPPVAKSGEQQPLPQYIYRTNVNSHQVSPYSQGYPSSPNYPNAVAYTRDSLAPQATPFFGLSSNGEFQLSAYFSQIFWGFVALVVGVAVIIWLIRLFFPSETLGDLVKKVKESGSGRAIDLDRLTNLVYSAFDSYGKWAAKDTRDGSGHHPKRR